MSAEGEEPAAVRVRRTGGFVGRTVEGAVGASETGARAEEVRRMAARVDLPALAAAPHGSAYPDMYAYEVTVGDVTVRVPEHLLTPELRRLAELVLPDPAR